MQEEESHHLDETERHLFLSYLRPLFFSQLHLPFDEFLPSTCLLLESFLQFLPSFPLLLQCLLPHVHLPLLRNNFNRYKAIRHTSTHTYTSGNEKVEPLSLRSGDFHKANNQVASYKFERMKFTDGDLIVQ